MDEEQQAFAEYARRAMSKIPLSRPVRYETRQFAGNRGMRLIFRKLGQEEKEHWLNHFAVAITSPIMPPYNRPPWSNNCHTEVVMDIAPGCTVRLGTMYKFAEKDEKGETIWKPGKLFVSEISQGELQKYETILLPSTRDMETRMLCFALRNLETPFNETAYKMRAIMPRTPGMGYYDPETQDVRKPVVPIQDGLFCTQLTVILLQAAAHEHVRQRKEAQRYVQEKNMVRGWPEVILDTHATSCVPNNLYYMIRTTPGVKFTTSRPDISFLSIAQL